MESLREDRKSILIIGGGIAGITAALELSALDNNVLLIDKAPFIGGHGALLACKATDRCIKCNNCLVEDKLQQVPLSKSLSVETNTRVRNIERNGQVFHVSLVSTSNCIDPAKCTNCGICLDKCLEIGGNAIVIAPSSHIRPSYAIDVTKCLCVAEGRELACEGVCPEGAIKIHDTEKEWSIEAHVIVVATGFQPYDPSQNKRYGIGRIDNVVTATEIEEMLRKQGKVLCKPDGRLPQRIAFVQCVGSRDHRIGRDYCSRVCCGYALRMALRLAYDHEGILITVFYMDVQNFGKDFDRYYSEARDKLRLVRGLPGEYYASEGGKVSLSFFDDQNGATVHEEFDMVILSVGMGPSMENSFFQDKLGLSHGDDGFLVVPSQSSKGIFLAGSVRGPMDVAESIRNSKGAVQEIVDYLETL